MHHAQMTKKTNQVKAPMLMNTITRSRITLERRSSDLHRYWKMVHVMMMSSRVPTVAAMAMS